MNEAERQAAFLAWKAEKQASYKKRLRSHGLEPATEEDRRPSGREWIQDLEENGWDPWNPSPQCLGRTAIDSFDFGGGPGLAPIDRDGIYWRTVLLELNWYFGYGRPAEERVGDWRMAAVLFVLRDRQDATGNEYDALDAEKLWWELEEWYTLRFRLSYRRLLRCERALRMIFKSEGESTRAGQLVRRWSSSCEPALTAQAILNERPHLHLDDERARAGLNDALYRHDHPRLEGPRDQQDGLLFPMRGELDPRQILSFLTFAGRTDRPRRLIDYSPSGDPVVLNLSVLTALRQVFGDQRPNAAEKDPPVSLDSMAAAGSDLYEDATRMADTADEVDRRESLEWVLDELDAIDSKSRTSGARQHLIEHARAVLVGEGENCSLAELARRAGVDESTMREASERLNAEVEARLGRARRRRPGG